MNVPQEIVLFAEAKQGLGILDNRTLKAACKRHGVPVIVFSETCKALSADGYRQLLDRHTEEKAQ